MTSGRLRVLAALLLLGGCTYRSVPPVPPPGAALTAPLRPIAGTWLARIDTDRLSRQAALHGGASCRAASYPVEAGEAFGQTLRQALERAFDRVEVVRATPSIADVRRARASGLVVVESAQFEPRADIEQRPFGAMVRATTALAANVTVDREFRRAFEGTVEASGEAAVPIGLIFDCGAVREAVNQATSRAVQQLAARVAERLVATPGLRPPPLRPPPRARPAPAAPQAGPAPGAPQPAPQPASPAATTPSATPQPATSPAPATPAPAPARTGPTS